MLRVDGHVSDKKGILREKKWIPYKQVFVVYAQQMPDEFEVVTDAGHLLRGKKGDYLVWGPLGNKWPISKEAFERNYEPI